MEFLSTTTWADVFNGWRSREAGNAGWIECATKIKGWPNWESWRSFTAEQFGASKREWKRFRFDNPLAEIPALLVGPFSSWQSRVVKTNHTTFSQLVENEEQYKEWKKHPGVLQMLKGLPFSTELIGLMRADTKQIVCIDGHHRATAIALAQKEKKRIDFSKTPISIAVAELRESEIGILDQMLARGTNKNPSAT